MVRIFSLFFFIFTFVSCFKPENNSKYSILNEVLECKSLKGLKLKYGSINLVEDTSWVIGDDTLRGSIIFMNSPKEAFVYYHFGKIVDVTIKGKTSEWLTKSGLYLGMTLMEVQHINKKNFTISGFNWAHGGSVVSWEGGKLAGDSSLNHFASFTNRPNENRIISNDAYKKISGEAEFDIRHLDIQKMNPKLDLISIIIPEIPSKSEGIKIGSQILKSQIPN